MSASTSSPSGDRVAHPDNWASEYTGSATKSGEDGLELQPSSGPDRQMSILQVKERPMTSSTLGSNRNAGPSLGPLAKQVEWAVTKLKSSSRSFPTMPRRLLLVDWAGLGSQSIEWTEAMTILAAAFGVAQRPTSAHIRSAAINLTGECERSAQGMKSTS
jgi:hypothetical protein